MADVDFEHRQDPNEHPEDHEPDWTDVLAAAIRDEFADELAGSGAVDAALDELGCTDVLDALAQLRDLRAELEMARVVTTLYAWTGGRRETERELALFQAWHEYVIRYGMPELSPEWDERIADLAARRRARMAEVRAGLPKIVATEEGESRG